MPYPTNLPPLLDAATVKHPACILAACDDKYAFCLFVSLKTLWKHSPHLAKTADIWVAGFHLSAASKRILAGLPHTRVVDYTFPGVLPDTPAISIFTAASFARYECFRLLSRYERVLYLDSDVLVQQELSPVFDTLSCGIGLVEDPCITSVGRNFTQPVTGFDMNARGFNSGFLVLRRTDFLQQHGTEITNFLYQQTISLAPVLYYPDQGILNLALQSFQLTPTVLGDTYNCPASRPTAELKKAHIIHATGPRKFWCYYYFDEFYTYYTQWILQGGNKVSVRKDDSPLYRWLIRKTGLDTYIFVQLCPDFIARPFKALRFFIKKMFRMKF